jgi:hypothetical protein
MAEGDFIGRGRKLLGRPITARFPTSPETSRTRRGWRGPPFGAMMALSARLLAEARY